MSVLSQHNNHEKRIQDVIYIESTGQIIMCDYDYETEKSDILLFNLTPEYNDKDYLESVNLSFCRHIA